MGVSDEESKDLSRVLGCIKGFFRFNYLGVPVRANVGLKKHWKPIIDKFRSKLSDWKSKILSFGGCIILIRSVLNNLSTYFMPLFKAPQGIIDTLEKIIRNFLFRGGCVN